jgi:predicted ATPase
MIVSKISTASMAAGDVMPSSTNAIRIGADDYKQRQKARKLLASVYGWSTEGFDTRDLNEAKGLLEELAASRFVEEDR